MLLHRVETYLRMTRTPPTRFGRDVLNDPCLVFDLRDGRRLRPVTEAKVDAFLIAHAPQATSEVNRYGRR